MRPQPRVGGEARQVRHAGAQVVGEARQQRPGRLARALLLNGGGDPHRRALAHCEVALGRELAVGLGHHAARYPERGRQPARRRQRGARREPPGLDVLTQPPLELLMKRKVAVMINWTSESRHNWHCNSDQQRRTVRTHGDHHDRRRRGRGADRGDHLRGGRRAGRALRCPRGARRPRAQPGWPVPREPRPARPLQGSAAALARRARARPAECRSALDRHPAALAGRSASHPAARNGPLDAAPARPPRARRRARSAPGSPATRTIAPPTCCPRSPASTRSITTPASSPPRSFGSGPAACSRRRRPSATWSAAGRC